MTVMVLLPGFHPGAAGAEAPLPVAPLPVLVVPEPEAEFELTAVPPQPAASSAAPRAATPVSSALRGILLEVNSVAFQLGQCFLLWLRRTPSGVFRPCRGTSPGAGPGRDSAVDVRALGVVRLLVMPAVRMTVLMYVQTIG